MNNDILTPEEKARVILFNQDEALKNAVKKVMLADIYDSGTVSKDNSVTRNWAYNLIPQDRPISNTELGEQLRGMIVGLAFLEEAFKRVEKYKSQVEVAEDPNPAV